MKEKNIVFILLFVILINIMTGCTSHQKITEHTNENSNQESGENSNMEIEKNMRVTIGNETYQVILEDNETTKAFIRLLPKEFSMSELNGNEKYIYMEESLPTNEGSPKQIRAGDIMLYGNDCLVIFYKSFQTSYRYTKIGHIENLPDLGNQNVVVKFEK